MDELTIEEQKIVIEMADKHKDVFYSIIGENYLKGLDLSTNVWDAYNKLNEGKNGRK